MKKSRCEKKKKKKKKRGGGVNILKNIGSCPQVPVCMSGCWRPTLDHFHHI